MTLTVLDIPDDKQERSQWLENRIASAELHLFVAETQLLLGTKSQFSVEITEKERSRLEERLREVCGTQLVSVCQNGLTALNAIQLNTLLSEPNLLIVLQAYLLESDELYWEQRFSQGMREIDIQKQWDLISDSITAPSNLARTSIKEKGQDTRQKKLGRVIFALAATVLIAVAGWQFTSSKAPGWGFERSGILAANVDGNEYLESLATAAGDWFNKRPNDSSLLSERLLQFSHGCDVLITAPHNQLQKQDKLWLVEKCRLWKSKIDNLELAVRENRIPIQAAIQEADETINKLIKAIRTRGNHLSYLEGEIHRYTSSSCGPAVRNPHTA